MARKKTASTMVAAALRKVCDALEQVFTKFSMDTFKGLRVKQLPAVVLVVASPTSSEIECHDWGWMSDRRLMPHVEHLLKNAYAVRQLQAPAPQVRVKARKQQSDDIQRPEAESYFVRNLGRLAWQMVLEPALQNTFGTAAQYVPHMCNKGVTKDLSARQIGSWAPTVDLRKELCLQLIAWAESRDERYAAKVAELRATREELTRSFEEGKQEGKQAAKRAGARSMAADLLDGDLSDAEGLEEDVVDVGGRNGQTCHRAGTSAVDQQQLQCAFERFNTRKKKEGMSELRAALAEMGVRLSRKELGAALKTAGLSWGQPTPQQMTEAFQQFDQLREMFGEEEAIGMVTGMAGFKTTVATRKKLVDAGLLEARKRGRPGWGLRSGHAVSAVSTDDDGASYSSTGEDGAGSTCSSQSGGADDLDPDAPCVVAEAVAAETVAAKVAAAKVAAAKVAAAKAAAAKVATGKVATGKMVAAKVAMGKMVAAAKVAAAKVAAAKRAAAKVAAAKQAAAKVAAARQAAAAVMGL
ncbi:hypothetical protein VOLCADRAFT_107175 [Volvox carteri f. nagariensis]|uniref:Uncharacterized protein n=1 Tax=Volvox carteri f. nagariensis TaxID=3068 RepID=D8UCE5_VOLCA|nr:uncharacterized protein VOLCADRAFT_107175 [Volvox carteri f. nagariensis]EFJ42633.1 hypothetical protein VOLCADRAFT_107175 [Volvox carteri f. nagariensis]|eukprot:XP_002956284.1 hypothetical protein VOLCADRAFT_107175 [Volvox carteri f. nagariensis]